MLSTLLAQNILFLDIETVPQNPSFADAPKAMQSLWEKKSAYMTRENEETPESIYRQAGIYAEFGKVVCISCGFFTPEKKFRIKSLAGDDEKKILTDFSGLLQKFFLNNDKQL